MAKGKKKTKFIPLDQVGKEDNNKIEESKIKKGEPNSPKSTNINVTGVKEIKEEKKSNDKNEKKKIKDEKEDFSVCIICTENVSLYAIGVCDHPICHKCSLRLRLLYGTKECPYCKVI